MIRMKQKPINADELSALVEAMISLNETLMIDPRFYPQLPSQRKSTLCVCVRQRENMNMI